MNSNEDIKSEHKHNIRDVGAPNQFVDNIDAHDVWRLQNEEARVHGADPTLSQLDVLTIYS